MVFLLVFDLLTLTLEWSVDRVWAWDGWALGIVMVLDLWCL
jgi:hypothetical protein